MVSKANNASHAVAVPGWIGVKFSSYLAIAVK